MATYPSAIYAPGTKSNGQTIQASWFNDPDAEIVALETALKNGITHALVPDANGTRALGSTSAAWGLTYVAALNLKAATELTIATGAVTATQGFHSLDTESNAASDDIDSITAGTGLQEGALLLLRAENVSRVVTLKDGTGNLLLSADYALSATDRNILLYYDGSNWREIARSLSSPPGITSNGTAVQQIAFAATQSASTDVNTLDDYEEGSWTPGLSFGGGTTGITYTTQSGHYVKWGKNVEFTGIVTLSAKGSSSGNAKITGLPFTEGDNLNRAVWFGDYSNVTGLASGLIGAVDNNGTSASIKTPASGGATSVTDSSLQNNTSIVFGGFYRAAS